MTMVWDLPNVVGSSDGVDIAQCGREVSVLEAKGLEAPSELGPQAIAFDVGAGVSHGSPMTMVVDSQEVVGSSSGVVMAPFGREVCHIGHR